MRHAYKPLFENLPACRDEGCKFRVFPPLFEEKHGKSALSRAYFAHSGRSLTFRRPLSDPRSRFAVSGRTLVHVSRLGVGM
jgi:hypothetical protein